jgi:hypothetical protein
VAIPDNVATVWMAIVRSIVPGGHAIVDFVVGLLDVTLGAIGLVTCWRRARVMTLFLAGYLGIGIVWPFSLLRFVWGIWPLLMLLPAVGIVTAGAPSIQNSNRAAPAR